MKFDKDVTITRNGEDLEIEVEYDATPYVPATWMQPPEGGEIEIIRATLDGVPIELTEAEEEYVRECLYESMDDSDFDDDPDWDRD